MTKKIVLIIGAGHLAYRLKKFLSTQGYEILHSNLDQINAATDSVSLIENLDAYIKKIDLSSLAMVYLLEDKDENNLQLIISLISLATNIPITASLFNENLIPHLQKDHINLKILNPAKIAAPAFVEQLYIQVNTEAAYANILLENNGKEKNSFSLIQKLLLGFVVMLLCAITFFHFLQC